MLDTWDRPSNLPRIMADEDSRREGPTRTFALRGVYGGRSVLVTGAASFIGSHLVERLLELGADVFAVDDFSSGRRENLIRLDPDRILELDLADRAATLASLPPCEYVFHLAAVHGGRGFIDRFGDQVLVNLVIDNAVFEACRLAGTRRLVYASSACVYPTTLQAREADRSLLREEQAGFHTRGAAFADGPYGWCKLMGELQLEQIAERAGFT